ncbi:MAG: TRIC cation channel family protein [Eubacteriales bacterium]
MSLFVLLEYIGIVAFSVAAAITAIEFKFDIFGIYVLSLITSLGGGIIRDLLLGITPPTAFVDIIYFLICMASTTVFLIILFILSKKNAITFEHLKDKKLSGLLIVFDAIGLAVFTIAGTNIAISTISTNNILLPVFIGVITGVGGGLLRDILVNRKPILLTKEIYALAAIVGSVLYCFTYKLVPEVISLYGCSVLILLIRLLTIYKKLDLPRLAIYNKN